MKTFILELSFGIFTFIITLWTVCFFLSALSLVVYGTTKTNGVIDFLLTISIWLIINAFIEKRNRRKENR